MLCFRLYKKPPYWLIIDSDHVKINKDYSCYWILKEKIIKERTWEKAWIKNKFKLILYLKYQTSEWRNIQL